MFSRTANWYTSFSGQNNLWKKTTLMKAYGQQIAKNHQSPAEHEKHFQVFPSFELAVFFF